MRYLPIDRIEEDAILAAPVYNDSGNILLSANSVLKRSYLDRLSRLGYAGLYIYDDISKDIVSKELVPEELIRTGVASLKSFNLDACRAVAHSIVDELLKQSDISIDMVNIASFDGFTYLHSINVAVLSVIIGMAYNMDGVRLRLLSEAALLHDIGKLSIDLELLNKKGTLSEQEWEILRSHPQAGYDIIKDNIPMSALVKNAILSHHENEDGSGYPRQLEGKQIHLFAKIIRVCDVYDAMVTNRPYRKALNPAEALEYLMSNCWVMFDIDCVRKIMTYVSPYPTGITVELSNGRQALIVSQNNLNRVRPKVLVIDTKEEIDLMEVLNLTIVKVLT